MLAPTIACSFIHVDAPPAMHEQMPYFECTSSYVWPVLDSITTGIEIVSLITVASISDAQWDETFQKSPFGSTDPPYSRQTRLGIDVAAVTILAASMYYGYSKVGACKDAKQELTLRVGAGPVGSWPPPHESPPSSETAPP